MKFNDQSAPTDVGLIRSSPYVAYTIRISNLYLIMTPKTRELPVETPLVAPNWIDAPHVGSQRTARRGFAPHTPVLHLEESIHLARLQRRALGR